MKTLVVIAGLLVYLSSVGRCARAGESLGTTAPANLGVARGLIARIAAGKASRFVVESIAPQNGKDGMAYDVFEVETWDGKTVLRGNSAVAIASAFNWFLREKCNSNLSWNAGDRVVWPTKWPVVAKARVVSPHRMRFAYNFCTFGYTSAWWDWAHWEHELDFLATQGINSALVVPGIEAVYIEALRDAGYSDEEVRKWLVMPSHMPWMLMGNMHSYGGPVPASVVAKRLELGQKIVVRMRELGMEPMLPGYYGMVPPGFAQKNPDAKVLPQGNWSWLQRPDLLDPSDSHFASVASSYYRALQKDFGDCRYFAADPFHEGGNSKGVDLSAAGTQIFAPMRAANPDATWVLQAWSGNPKMALIRDVPRDKTLIIDLACETREGWRANNGWDGARWIWGTIHNFGGNQGFSGRLDWLGKGPVLALNDPGAGGMRGIGALMEGSETNPALWEMFFGNAWRTEAPNLDSWLRSYALRRYGSDSPAILATWKTLAATVYNSGGSDGEFPINSVVAGRPTLDPGMRARPYVGTEPFYDTTQLVGAWKNLLEAAPQCRNSDGYRYDLADVSRQVLANYATRLHNQIVEAFNARDASKTRRLGEQMLKLVGDMDELAGTRREWLLGTWLHDARQWGSTTAEKDLAEQNARTLLTTWTNPQSHLDYANREWNGLLSGFYRQRWQMWVTALNDSLAQNQPLDEKALTQKIQAWEYQWQRQHEAYATQPKGDTIAISRRLFAEWSALATKGDVNEHTLSEGVWTPAVTSLKSGEWVLDASPQITGAGDYEVKFQWLKGQSALRIFGVTLEQNGVVVARDVHEGWTGTQNTANTYLLKVPSVQQGVPVTLHANIAAVSSKDSSGTISISRVQAP
ncbi:hypothetical protein IAD21_04588 [Abditibacteriota bacterium]|nr:hypothetical protein IAD21_04588 [Abditibacteriota bacterium]